MVGGRVFVVAALLLAGSGRAQTAWADLMLQARAHGRDLQTVEQAGLRNGIKAQHPDLLPSFEALCGLSFAAWLRAPSGRSERQAVAALLPRLSRAEAQAAQGTLATLADADAGGLLRLFATVWEQAGRAEVATLPPLAFVRRRAYGLRGTNATMFAHRTDRGSDVLVWDPQRPREAPRVILDSDDGFVWDLRPSYDGRRLLLSYKESNNQPFHVWELGVDGRGMRRITFGPYHDFNPVYYPDGRVVFCSSRVESYSLCQNFLASALYVCDADGANLHRIDYTTLCSSAPAILPDGSILCTRWEYQDKNIFSWQGLWTIRPDGRQLRLYFGNTFTVPNSRYGGKPVPGTDDVLITMAAHHHPPVADVAVVDRGGGPERLAGMRKATFETPYAISRGRSWRDTNWGPGDTFYPFAVTDPWPLHDGLFLAAIGNDARPAAGFRLCLCRYDGSRYPVLAVDGESYFAPVSLAPRAPERALPDAPTDASGEGTCYVHDVYQGLLDQGVRRGQVKALRLVRQTPKKWNTEGPRFHDHYPIVGYGSYYIKENLGEVPVDEDGSAYFRAPANCELYFIALDAEGREVRRMGSVTQLTSGEQVACVGCHESRQCAPPATGRNATRLTRPPDTPRVPHGRPGPFDYPRDVQPVWDRYCVSCHSGRTPAAGVDLSGDATRFFSMSYDALVERGQVAYYFINPGPTGIFPALGSGSMVSRLTALLTGKHGNVDVDPASRRRVYAWVDSNIQYYATWDMSRPYTIGGRDTWSFVRDNQRVAPQHEPWLLRLAQVHEQHCQPCHRSLAVAAQASGGPEDRWINLTRPAFSRLVNAHLSKQAGGLGLRGKRAGRDAPVFAGTDDPVYQALLAAIEQGRAALAARPRMDMPGGRSWPQERNFGRVF